jgi:hypothetical protein
MPPTARGKGRRRGRTNSGAKRGSLPRALRGGKLAWQCYLESPYFAVFGPAPLRRSPPRPVAQRTQFVAEPGTV